MKKLLILFASLTLAVPAANAESVWLVVETVQCGHAKFGCNTALEKIQMASMSQCHKNGKVWNSDGYASKDRPEKSKDTFWWSAYKCLEGK